LEETKHLRVSELLWEVTKKTGSGDGGPGRNYEGLENARAPTFNEASIFLKTNIRFN
jgi:hypothetical protein